MWMWVGVLVGVGRKRPEEQKDEGRGTQARRRTQLSPLPVAVPLGQLAPGFMCTTNKRPPQDKKALKKCPSRGWWVVVRWVAGCSLGGFSGGRGCSATIQTAARDNNRTTIDQRPRLFWKTKLFSHESNEMSRNPPPQKKRSITPSSPPHILQIVCGTRPTFGTHLAKTFYVFRRKVWLLRVVADCHRQCGCCRLARTG